MNSDVGPFRRSMELHERARVRAPGGVHSNVRLAGPRVFFNRAEGAWLHSVDGVTFVDYLLGQGPNFFGHVSQDIVAEVFRECDNGLIFGGQHELEIVAAEMMCDVLGWPDMVRFCSTGTEAVQIAVRLARAVSGRTKVIRFEGHYHGWLDNILMAPDGDGGGWGVGSDGQLPGALDELIILPWNDADRVAETLEMHADDICAVIMEPVMINAGVIEPRNGYLQRVRELCSKHDVLLIFDEIISGFRLGLTGAAGHYQVTPDLATYGKALGAGFLVAAVAGGRDLMENLGHGDVNHAGTFNSSVMATAAVRASLTRLCDDPPYEDIAEHGVALMQGLREIGEVRGVPIRVEGLPQAFHVSFCEDDVDVTDYRTLHKLDLKRYADFAWKLIEQGIWVAPRGIWYVSASHGPQELDAALSRFGKALSDSL